MEFDRGQVHHLPRMFGAESCLKEFDMELSDEEADDLLAKITWRLDHFGPIAEDGTHHSRFETPAHAALDAVEDWLKAIETNRILTALNEREKPYPLAYVGQGVILRFIKWLENIDNFLWKQVEKRA